MFNPDQLYAAEQARRMELYAEAEARWAEGQAGTAELPGLVARLITVAQLLRRHRARGEHLAPTNAPPRPAATER